MAFRFRRTVSIFPGVRLNLGKRGVSVSAGLRGASVTLGRNGLYGNVGIPGTGLSYRERLLEQDKVGTRKRSKAAQPSPELPPLAGEIAQVRLNTRTGDIAILDSAGNDLGPEAFEIAKTHAREDLDNTLQQQVDTHNRMMERIGNIHLDTPAPDTFPAMVAEPFEEPEPTEPALRKRDWLAVICPARRKAFDESNERRRNRYRQAYQQWQQDKVQQERREVARAGIYEKAQRGDVTAMESVLDDHLLDIDWPRETDLSFELSGEGTMLMMDVDLPEIEDFPTTELRTYQRGVGVSVKELSDTASRKLYMAHVHGMGFRLIGEGFACAPSVETVVLSAFTQVTNAATGRGEDKYLYSVKVTRQAWSQIHFGNLSEVDPVEALAAFELRRDMTKTGIFRAIEPLDADYAPGHA
ncbi:DUF4236 domain-containing protein [Marinobacter orientalis]|uniref:DUF4236 domain-containing protein n=1 Tax=Marinobacter orientalis TaxID=1928859 RepID=A0A7Y0RC02_9GAMM|nr:DUF4236 domain-containing protein [Marinobacter orientalis]NMT63440.1 DUF4236 domain-containing protein [Marinobacter orientalis]TGX48502.1 DUF4236 domain-containing protein [Marinobacter orientalis]